MNKSDETRGNDSALGFTLAIVALTIFFCLPLNAMAQEWTTNATNINNTNTGNVGIGTNPTTKLDINGVTTFRGHIIAGTDNTYDIGASGATRPRNIYAAGAGEFASFLLGGAMAGNLTLRVNGNASNNTNIQEWRTNAGASLSGVNKDGWIGVATGSDAIGDVLDIKSPGNGYGMRFRSSTSGISAVGGFREGATGQAFFFLREGTGLTDKVWIDANGSSYLNGGNVGIGTTTPGVKLDVNGNTKITGNIEVTGTINAKYQDVAEWVPAVHALPAGTVVVLNPKQSNQVMPSAQAYDTRVAGVVSARPGLALGEAGPDKVLVATTGRVKVKVDATRSPIHVGDLLVTGEQEGVAMKSLPLDLGGTPIHRPGTLIGKALENLEKGTGEILVLLSLQ